MTTLLLEDKMMSVKCDFVGTLEDEMTVEDLDYVVQEGLEAEEDFIETAAGASKVVVIYRGLPYVVKIPAIGQYCCCEDEDEDDECSTDKFIPFSGGNGDNAFDYCAAEVDIYEEAAFAGFEKYFAKTSFWKRTESGYPLYIQERVNTGAWNYVKEPSAASKTIAESYNRFCYKITDPNWVASFIDFFGEMEFLRFSNFLEEHELNDFHSGNLGYRLRTGEPVIFDYSGFYD